MQNFPKLQKKYDHVLIGFNLSSATFAHYLKNKNESYCIVDSKHFGSSPIKMIPSLETRVSTRVPFNASFEVEETDTPIWGEIKKVDGPPLTFDKGNFKSFLGFGDLKIESQEAVTPFLSTESHIPQLQVENQWEKIINWEEDPIFLDQQITDIQLENNQVDTVTLNAKTQLRGENFYFFDHFDFLFDKLGNHMKKVASQFGKCKWYSSVNMVIHHEVEPEQWEADQLYLLMGSKLQPCLGMFSRIEGHLISRWEAFFPAELTADDETTGSLVKEIKKQFKRAFGFPEDPKDNEHILVHHRVYSDMEKFSFEGGLLPQTTNLYAFSPLFEGRPGWVSEVQSGLKAAAELVENPVNNSQAEESPSL